MKKLFSDFNKILIILLVLFVITLFVMFPSTIKYYFAFGLGIVLLIGTYFLIKDSRAKSKNPNSFGDILGTIVICIFMLPMSFAFMIMPFYDQVKTFLYGEEEKVADGFTIDDYEVILDVGIDNKINVTENIDIYFYEKGHHGIYKVTPTWLKYTGKDNETIKRRSLVSNYLAVGDNYTLEKVGSKEKIKIGNKNITVYGKKGYSIKYTYDMGSDPYKGFDEFIFHAFGDFWGTQIKNPKVVIHMPKDIGNANINVFLDKYRNNNVNDRVNIERDGTTITITPNDLFLNRALTVDIELPENYFIGGSNTYGIISLIISIVVIIITGYIIYMWFKHGKDLDKEVPTVEFYSPDNLNAAEIGYIFNRCNYSNKLTIALIVSLASKGYIKIDEVKGKKKKDSYIKISQSDAHYTEPILKSASITKRQVVVKKLDYKESVLKPKEKEMLSSLFSDGESVKVLSDNFDEFDKIKKSLLTKKCIEIVSDDTYNMKSNLNEYVKPETRDLSLLDSMERKVYNKLFEGSNVVVLKEHKTFYQVFKDIDNELKNGYSNRVYNMESSKRKKSAIIISSLLLLLSILSFFEVEDLNPKLSILYYISFGCVLVDYVFAILMDKKTKYGETISARVKGFRDFLITAEKEKLEALVEENPHYFYDILPYTYVLNVSKKWIEKFQDIKMPDENMGNVNFLTGDALFSSVASSISFPSSSSGSSGSGGGCSSCGGGCSSCGGGGSW